MAPEDWRLLARVLRAGEKRTWGIHEAATHHLGTVLRVMAEEADAVAGEAGQQQEGGVMTEMTEAREGERCSTCHGLLVNGSCPMGHSQ